MVCPSLTYPTFMHFSLHVKIDTSFYKYVKNNLPKRNETRKQQKTRKKHELLYESFNLPLATNILETIKNYFAIFMSSDKKEI